MLSLILSSASHADQALIYAPLPLENMAITQARNQPLADLLTELLGREVRMQLVADHAGLIDALATGEVDFAELGPLPFLLARERDPDLRPIASFREPDGRADYRCVIVAPVDGISSLVDRAGGGTDLSVALTRRQSTCGPVATFSLLADAGLALSEIQAAYQGGHDDVAIAVLREQFLIGGMKESVALTFHALGLRVLAASDPVPGFVLVSRSGVLSERSEQDLTAALIGLGNARRQGLQNGRHGFAEFEEDLFKGVDSMRLRAEPFLDRVAD